MVKAVAILLLFIFSSGCVDPSPPENVIRFVVNVTDEGVVHMPTNNDHMDFGGLPPGAVTEKIIGFDGNGAVRLDCEGDICDWTTFHPARFVLNGHQNVTVCIRIPMDAIAGSYVSNIVER